MDNLANQKTVHKTVKFVFSTKTGTEEQLVTPGFPKMSGQVCSFLEILGFNRDLATLFMKKA